MLNRVQFTLIAALNPCPSGYHGSKNLMEYSHPIRTLLLLRMTSGERDFSYFFVLDRLNIGQILRLQRLTPFPLRMTKWEGFHSIGANYLGS